MTFKSKTLLWLILLVGISFTVIAQQVATVTVATKAPHNKKTKFYYRVPAGYDASSRELYRVLVYFGGRNTTGESEVRGSLGFDRWADENKVFLVAPGFKDDDYWYPEKWSGKALLEALAQLKQKYRICDNRLLFYGFSGGSQCANLFPAWKPQLAVAWVSHACGVWHRPSSRMAQSPGLVTCGDADIQRYLLSRNFVETSRKLGVPII